MEDLLPGQLPATVESYTDSNGITHFVLRAEPGLFGLKGTPLGPEDNA